MTDNNETVNDSPEPDNVDKPSLEPDSAVDAAEGTVEDSGAETVADAVVEAAAEAELEPELELAAEPETESELETAPELEAEPTLAAESELDPATELEPESAAEPAVEPAPELEPEPELEPTYDDENAIADQLKAAFNEVTVSVQRSRRIWVEVPRRSFIQVLTYLRDELDFISLMTITGLDLGDQFQLIYHLATDSGMVINVKQNAPRSQPQFDTATGVFKGGVLYELEVRNLFGLIIRGIPEDIKYPLPDSWPARSYPLRKDWVSLTEQEKKPQARGRRRDKESS